MLHLTITICRYEELVAQLPDHVKSDYYCSVLLANLKTIAGFMCQVCYFNFNHL